jgi:hypothetical protein
MTAFSQANLDTPVIMLKQSTDKGCVAVYQTAKKVRLHALTENLG